MNENLAFFTLITGSAQQRSAAPVRGIPAGAPVHQQQQRTNGNAVAAHSTIAQIKPFQAGSAAPGRQVSQLRDEKQRNVLSVIQNLIQHKKQTLATLARASPVAT